MTPAERDACFERWIRDHVAILYRVAHAFAVGDDRHDLMQELMLAVWKSVPDFRAEAKPSTFIYRVSHNAALTWKRTQRNRLRQLERFTALAADAPSGPTAHERDALERVYDALRKLPELDRSLVLMTLDGLTYREVAEIHGLSESNVGVRLTRLKARLSKSLQEDDK